MIVQKDGIIKGLADFITLGIPVMPGGVEMIAALTGLFVLPELYNMAALAPTAQGGDDPRRRNPA